MNVDRGWVQITRGLNKGHCVKVLSRWAYGIEVTSPYGGREWTLNEGDYTQVPCALVTDR